MITKVRARILEATVAGFIAALIIMPIYIFQQLDKINSKLSDPSDYFIVNNVHVGDAEEGEDHRVIYDRIVVRPFRGRWIAGVFSVPTEAGGTTYGVCNGSSEVDYKPSVVLPKTGVTLTWYMESDCVKTLPPGKYTLRTVWEIQLPGEVVKRVRYTSNIFEVLPRGEGDE